MQNQSVLKSGYSYLVHRLNWKQKSCIRKIAMHDNNRLDCEIALINSIGDAYPRLKLRIPAILDNGTIGSGALKGKRYYIQEFVDGVTLSKLIQNETIKDDQIEKIFVVIARELINMVGDYQGKQKTMAQGTTNLKLLAELETLNKKSYFDDILKQQFLVINNRPYNNLNEVLVALPEIDETIVKYSHWNFHGDNIILDNNLTPDEFKIIDPDSTLSDCDELFNIARFIYTFTHDTFEYRKYLINSQFLQLNGDKIEFEIYETWPIGISNRRERLLASLFNISSEIYKSIETQALSRSALYRLKLNYLYCVLRGVNSNYKHNFEFPSAEFQTFRHDGIFLLLKSTIIANDLLREING